MYYPSSPPVVATRLDGQELSMSRPPCRTSTTVSAISWSTHTFGQTEKTHARDLIKVTRRVNPQNLDCNMAALVFTLPYIGIPTATQRVIQSVVTKWDLQ